MKYKLTKNTKEYFGIVLSQIEALKDFGNVSKGDLGGYIQGEDNLSQEGGCWVSGNARVYGDAQVSGDARVYGDAQVSGDAQVYGDALVYGNAWVSGDAQVYGDALVSGNARVYGNAQVYGNARVYGDAWVYGDASISPINIIGLRYSVTATDTHIKIGCEYHSISEWRDFTNKEILKMDGRGALEFWNESKDAILLLAGSKSRAKAIEEATL